MGKEMSGLIAILVLVVIGYAIIFAGSAKVTDNLADRAASNAIIAREHTAQVQTHEDNATQRADSRNITLAAITAMVISQAGGGNWLVPLFVGAAAAWMYMHWRDSQPRG